MAASSHASQASSLTLNNQRGLALRSSGLHSAAAELKRQAGNSGQAKNPNVQTWELAVDFNIECEREEDGRWLAEVPQLPGVLAYGATADEAMAKTEVLALRVLAERLEHGESRAHPTKISVAAV